MKKVIKLMTMISLITILLGTNVKAFTIVPTEKIVIATRCKMPYHYETEEATEYKMITYNGGIKLYTFNRQDDIPIASLTSASGYYNTICEKILENGYPKKTYQELGVASEEEAYFATQEAIYTYLEKKDINRYIAENEKGERILNCAKQILDKAKKEDVIFEAIDLNWKIDEIDQNFMYKQYRILLDSRIENVTIQLLDTSNVKVCTQENSIISSAQNDDIVKILVPKGMDQNFRVKLIYSKEGAILYRCYDSSSTNMEYLASEIETVQKEKTFDVKFQSLAPITITSYDNETKGKIQGSVFTILDQSQKKVKENLVTNEEGTVQTYLKKGKYFLKQTQVKEGYSLVTGMVSFEVKNIENIDLNMYNSKISEEEINTENTQINVTEENKKILENNVTNISNIHTTNIEKEIVNQTNETNFENVNHLVNITYQKNIRNITKENTYKNQIWKENVINEKMSGENETTNMTRDEYITYMDFIKIGSFDVPILPVALKQ